MKNSIISLFAIAVCLSLSFSLKAQVSQDSELHKTLKENDSLLFSVGFNTCDFKQFDKFLTDDLEFYHDKSGITNSKAEFMEVFKRGICGSKDFKARRELVEGSLKVFPLYDKGKLYGAIQNGIHRFFEKNRDQPETEGSEARFTHLWLKEEENWKLKRVLSYDHLMKVSKNSEVKVSVSKELLQSYVGSYEAPNSGKATISLIEDHLELSAGNMQASIFPSSEAIFFHKEAPLTFEFIRNSKGEVTKFIVRENGNIVEEALRLK